MYLRSRLVYIIYLSSFFLFNPNIVVVGQNIDFDYSLITQIDEIVDSAINYDLFSGSILIAKKGEIIYEKTFGEANKDFSIENTLETKFNVASITKPFTSTAILILAQQKLIKLNDPVKQYLKDFPFGNEITIHHLLTHTAGFGDYESNQEYIARMHSIKSLDEILSIIYKESLLFDTPGSDMSYSNSGLVILGAVIEEVTNKSYSSFVEENIFHPLEMTNSCFRNAEEVVVNRAVGFIKKINGDYIATTYQVSPPSPATGLITTVIDLFLFDQALYTNKLLNSEFIDMMFTPYMNNYGYCWGVIERFNNKIVGHAGGQPGFNAWFRRYLNDEYTIIVLSNLDSGADNIFFKIEALIFGEDYKLPRKLVGQFLYECMTKFGFGFTKQNIRELLKENNYAISKSGVLNNIGYNLLYQNEINMAINFFLLNTVLFKDDANVYDSLGEAYLVDKDTAKAMLYYKKALSLNPSLGTARKAIELLEKN